MTSICTMCKEVKDINEFYLCRKGKPWRNKVCKECAKARCRMYDKTPRGKEVSQRSQFKRRYGITLEEYNILLLEQKGVCQNIVLLIYPPLRW